MLNVQAIRTQFPGLHQKVHGKPLIYLDNAATTQKPQVVLDSLIHHYTYESANVHRGMHTLAERATLALEATRSYIQQYINAKSTSEIIFTSGVTASINLVAATYGEKHIASGDEILISNMEHHANILPWQRLSHKKRALLKVIPVNDQGELCMDQLTTLLTPKTKIVAINYVSNTLGTINPLKKIIQQAHIYGAVVVVDGAQAIPHFVVNMQELDCDFFTFSAHKAYGPTGVGILFGKQELLADMPPYQVGGGMVSQVTEQNAAYNDLPYKFEAGTPPIASIVAWRSALAMIRHIGYEKLQNHEQTLLTHATTLLTQIPEVCILGTAKHKIGIISFTIANMHPTDVGILLDVQGIAVRTGHSCTQPLTHFFGVEGVIRASLAMYNTLEEIELFVRAVKNVIIKRNHRS